MGNGVHESMWQREVGSEINSRLRKKKTFGARESAIQPLIGGAFSEYDGTERFLWSAEILQAERQDY